MTMQPVLMMPWKMRIGKSVFISSKKEKETEADIMGFFDRPLFDFNGDDAFYTGSDDLEEDDELIDELEMAGLDIDELADMDEDERREAIEDAGLDPDDYDDEF